ncbi:MAG: MOSC domain-containing protein [Proteobacteria bacterium]|nr:MOSC domain-containing protein [Pseudomonadota bacterium]MBS0573963.1 MOSC domain-containing protein [Pseudomonadota bacterium]
MPALIPTDHFGTIVWLGRVPDRKAALASQAAGELHATFAGPEGEAHCGLTRPSDSRVLDQYPRGTEIRNTRQLSILSREELDLIAAEMGLARLDPALVGASMVIAGIADFSHLPPSSRLQADGGATLVVDMQNRPCTLPGPVIEALHPGYGRAFKPAAAGRRGVTAWVEREGVLRLGARVRLHIPDQRPWAPFAEAGR